MDDRPLVTIREAAQLARVSRRTIYYWMDTNRIAFVRTAGGRRRIVADTLFQRGNQPAPAVLSDGVRVHP